MNTKVDSFVGNCTNASMPSSALNYPTVFTTQKLNNSTTKVNYTPYQLELLNSIYTDMKYPNSEQKTLIAKIIGITRDQVKIWFQNRRRKDTINSQTNRPTTSKGVKRSFSDENDDYSNDYDQQIENKPKRSLIGSQIIESVLTELRNHKNAPSRLSSKRAKLTVNENTKPINNENLLTNATQILDSQVLKKTPTNCIIDLQPIINGKPKTCANNYLSSNLTQQAENNTTVSSTSSNLSCSFTATSSSEEVDQSAKYLNIASNYDQKFQTVQKPYNIQNYLYKKYYPNYSYYDNQRQELLQATANQAEQPQGGVQAQPQSQLQENQQQQEPAEQQPTQAWSYIDAYNYYTSSAVPTTTSTNSISTNTYNYTNTTNTNNFIIDQSYSNGYYQNNYNYNEYYEQQAANYNTSNPEYYQFSNSTSYLNPMYQY